MNTYPWFLWDDIFLTPSFVKKILKMVGRAWLERAVGGKSKTRRGLSRGQGGRRGKHEILAGLR